MTPDLGTLSDEVAALAAACQDRPIPAEALAAALAGAIIISDAGAIVATEDREAHRAAAFRVRALRLNLPA